MFALEALKKLPEADPILVCATPRLAERLNATDPLGRLITTALEEHSLYAYVRLVQTQPKAEIWVRENLAQVLLTAIQYNIPPPCLEYVLQSLHYTQPLSLTQQSWVDFINQLPPKRETQLKLYLSVYKHLGLNKSLLEPLVPKSRLTRWFTKNYHSYIFKLL